MDGAKPIDGSVAAPVDPGKYQIGPEDLLFIRVWREPDFTLPVAVRPDGKITMPLIGEVPAAGQSPLQLTATLKQLLTQYLNNPDVNVFVTEVRSKKFYIDGEMNRPGIIRVGDAHVGAGGAQPWRRLSRIRQYQEDSRAARRPGPPLQLQRCHQRQAPGAEHRGGERRPHHRAVTMLIEEQRPARRQLDLDDYARHSAPEQGLDSGPLFVALVVSVVVAYLWPDTYISVATIRVAPPQVPESFVPANTSQDIRAA